MSNSMRREFEAIFGLLTTSIWGKFFNPFFNRLCSPNYDTILTVVIVTMAYHSPSGME